MPRLPFTRSQPLREPVPLGLLTELGDLAGRALPEAVALAAKLSAEVAELRARADRLEREAHLLALVILRDEFPDFFAYQRTQKGQTNE